MEEASGKSLSYIVGGSSGMGLANRRLVVADGGTVVLVAREQDKLAARKGEVEAGDKGKVETIAADFYDAEAVKSLIAKIDGETRHINHLVNAAGYFIPKNFLEYTTRDYDGYMDLNRAFFFVTQAVARNMVKNGGGSIVNIGSMWAHQASKGKPSFSFSVHTAGFSPRT